MQQFNYETIMDYSKLTIVRPPEIHSTWLPEDQLGALRVRLSIGRNRYRANPGLYRLGSPGSDSDVFVTANYKLSFDLLRKNLDGVHAWILVLETYGINVWCAAGKGTFGSDELIRQVNESRLSLYVSHRRLIVPQLGAPGVSAHKVKEATGFSVKFGPVRAEDIKEYISAGYRKDERARTVRFNIRDRFILAPVELANSLCYLLVALVFLMLLSGIHSEGYSFTLVWIEGWRAGLFLLAAYISGAFLAPLLLPFLPFRHFGGKGLVAGLFVTGLIILLGDAEMPVLGMLAWFLVSGAISSYLTMNFTGASTYTSLSGVRKEMGIFVPIQIASVFAGLVLLVISKLL
ncbi:MAG: mercury methylation corrinoid protein HgcA [Bacteroidota bacterium]|nr:mercury methylation corrinoid protein HgcA [Bacteroidota bacterium]